MSKRLHLAVTMWLLIPGIALSQPDPPVGKFTPATARETSSALLPSGTPGGAAGLTYVSRCLDTSPRQGSIAFSWQLSTVRGSAQRLDVSKFPEGFDGDRFDASGRLEADVASLALRGPEPGIYYYWRVLTETPSGWIPSPVARFEAPVCPSDGAALDAVDNED